MRVLCRIGLHNWNETVVRPTRDPGTVWNQQVCKQPDCRKEHTSWTITPGWCRETFCDSLYCGSDSEHPVHMESQIEQIKWQRKIRKEWQARFGDPVSAAS